MTSSVAQTQAKSQQKLDELSLALDSGTFVDVGRMLNGLAPADVAHLLESSPPKFRRILWQLVEVEQEGEVLGELNDELQSLFLSDMDAAEVVQITEGLEDDDIADILQQLPDRITREVLHSMDHQDTAPAGRAVMQGDGGLLEQAIENLMHNSVSAGATMVEIMVDCEPGELVLHVEDNGRGVPEDIGERIFDPMVSGRGSTGLGLAMAREIIEAHGGSLNLLPTSSGALFRISLPSAS